MAYKINVDECLGRRTSVHRNRQSPNDPPPDHGHRQRTRLPDCLFGRTGYSETVLQAAGKHDELCRCGHWRCGHHPVCDRHGGKKRQK